MLWIGERTEESDFGTQRRKSNLSARCLTTIHCVKMSSRLHEQDKNGFIWCPQWIRHPRCALCVAFGHHLAGSCTPVGLGFRSIRKWMEFLRHSTGRLHCEWSWPFMCVLACVCTCIYVCTFVYMYVLRMYVGMYACMDVYQYIGKYTCKKEHMYTSIYLCLYMCIHTLLTF